MPGTRLIGVFLYRSDLGKPPLYGEAREVQEIHGKVIIGVAARPPGDAIATGGTRDREQFVNEVEQKAVQWAWLDNEIQT